MMELTMQAIFVAIWTWLKTMWPVVGVPVFRSLAGWLENAMKDGIISKVERRLLFQTVLRVGMLSLATFYGVNGFSETEITALTASASGVLMDFVLMAYKKK